MPSPSPGLFPSSSLFPGGTPFTDGILSSTQFWNDPAGAWAGYNAALAAMFEEVFDIVADEGDPDQPASYTPGWSVLLDPANCPTSFLPYAGMFVGATIPPGTDDAAARAILQQEAGFQRGTPMSIVAAAQRWLTGTQSCVLLERTPDPYNIVLVVHPGEILDLVQLQAAVAAVKPAGIIATVVPVGSWTLFQMEGAYASITAVEAAFTTISGLESDQVGH